MSDRLDMLICIVPKIRPDAPTIGPSLLKSHLQQAGFTCEVLDLNIKLFNALKKHGTHEKYYFENDLIFSLHPGFKRIRDFVELSDEFNDFCVEYDHILMDWIETFKRKNPRWIGLSILTFYGQAMAIKISRLIRQHLPETKIVWGGANIEKGIETFKDKGLMDHYIYGDAEYAIVELLKGNLTAKGIDSLKTNQINLNNALMPNYDDIDWDEYHRIDDLSNVVYITGSRGCVKKCTFCDVYETWPEYRFRPGASIAEEIKFLRERYNRTTFLFTDSLINGSMKAFRSMMMELRDLRKTYPEIRWTSQWIIRPKNQSPEEDFKLMKESGCDTLDMGIESFSQSVRWHLGKKFTNEDMWWSLDMLRTYKIRQCLLMIVGYPTENEEDHKLTLETIRKLFESGYATDRDDDGFKLMYFNFAYTLLLWEGPLLDQIMNELTYYEDMLNWDYKGNDSTTRIRRYKEIYDLLDSLDKDRYRWMNKRYLSMVKYNKPGDQ